MGILFTITMGFLFTITLGILFTIVLGIQFTISIPASTALLTYGVHVSDQGIVKIPSAFLAIA